MLAPVHTCKDDDEDESSTVESKCEGDSNMYVDGVGTSRCMSDAATGPSHTVGYEDLLPSQCMSRDDREEHTSLTYVGPQSPLPTWVSPPLFSGFAHKGG